MPDEHDQLLHQWEQLPNHKDQCFIRDGIIDVSRWQTANRKVLFLLREAYDRKKRPEGYDLRQVIREKWKGPKTKTWWTVANWAFAALHGTSDRIPPLTEDSKQQRREALLSAAVVNLKKARGFLNPIWRISLPTQDKMLNSYVGKLKSLIHKLSFAATPGRLPATFGNPMLNRSIIQRFVSAIARSSVFGTPPTVGQSD